MVQSFMEESLRHFIENSTQPILVCDSNGKIIFTNKEVQILFGYTKKEIEGLTSENLIKPELRENHIKLRTDFLKNKKYINMGNRIITVCKKNGESLKVKVSLSPYFENFILIFSDYSEVVSYKNEIIDFFKKNKRGDANSQFINHLIKGPLAHIISSLNASPHRDKKEFKDLFKNLDQLKQNIDNFKNVLEVKHKESEEYFDHLLIIDDCESVHFLLNHLAKKLNLLEKVSFTLNGKEGFEKLKELNNEKVLILLDINMPVMGGFEFLKLFDPTSNHRIIMYSSSDDVKDINSSLNYPFVINYIVKPASVSLLKSKVFMRINFGEDKN